MQSSTYRGIHGKCSPQTTFLQWPLWAGSPRRMSLSTELPKPLVRDVPVVLCSLQRTRGTRTGPHHKSWGFPCKPQLWLRSSACRAASPSPHRHSLGSSKPSPGVRCVHGETTGPIPRPGQLWDRRENGNLLNPHRQGQGSPLLPPEVTPHK